MRTDFPAGIDRDYFTFLVPEGAVLSSIMLLEAETKVSGGVSFLAIQERPDVTVSPSGAGADAPVALGHYDNSRRGSDLLAYLKLAPGPFASGRHAVRVHETGGPASYGFDFVVTQVPEPAHRGLMLSGLPLVLMVRQRAKG